MSGSCVFNHPKMALWRTRIELALNVASFMEGLTWFSYYEQTRQVLPRNRLDHGGELKRARRTADHISASSCGIFIQKNRQMPCIPGGGSLRPLDFDGDELVAATKNPVHLGTVRIAPKVNSKMRRSAARKPN